VVIEAVALLKSRGMRLPVVMTGQPSDFRDPQNRALSELLQRIAEAELAGQVTVLGQVAYGELIALMRAAAVMVQPSQSEGWSTVVQDGKALGRPLICSGIATHREQAPEALGFFECDRAGDLADLLERHWESLMPGPDLTREAECLAREQEFARQHGRKLLRICEEARG
jgi:glycosyltransferase involved in cell wall biosynthesis